MPGEDSIERSLRLLPVPESAGAARHMVGAVLADRPDAAAVEAAVLLVSEVVTNAITHGGPHGPAAELVLRIVATNDRVRIEMHDTSPAVPTVGDGAPDRTSGRGMLLVASMSSDWGVVSSETGKVVWFEIDL